MGRECSESPTRTRSSGSLLRAPPAVYVQITSIQSLQIVKTLFGSAPIVACVVTTVMRRALNQLAQLRRVTLFAPCIKRTKGRSSLDQIVVSSFGIRRQLSGTLSQPWAEVLFIPLLKPIRAAC